MDTEVKQYKCGEIFLSRNSSYIFVCWYCKKKFDNFLSFQEHNEISHNECSFNTKDISITIKEEHFIKGHKEEKVYEQIEIEKYEASSENDFDSLTEMSWLKQECISENYESESNSSCSNFIKKNDKIFLQNTNLPETLKVSNHLEIEAEQSVDKVFENSDSENDRIFLMEDECYNNEFSQQFENEAEKANYQKQTSLCSFCNNDYKSYQKHDLQKCANMLKIIKNQNYNHNSLQYEGIYLCKKCPKYFDDSAKLTFHKSSHNSSGTCKICDKKYVSLDHHMKSQHPKETEKSFIKFKTEVTERESLQCNFCNKKFKFKIHLHKHELNHQNLRCIYCMKTFKAPILLKNHVRTHTGEKPFQCSDCPAAFALKRNLTTHFIYKHTDDKPFECRHESGCGKSFKTEQLRNNHEKRHSQKAEFQCEICGMGFNVKAKLRMHHKKRHMDYSQRPHPCRFCDKKFVEKDQLREHERTHTGEKPLKCNLCSSSFAKKSSLREHKKLHSGEKKHVCKICGKAFAQLAGYSNHIKNHP